METIVFYADDETELELGILEQTRINGNNYLLVVEPDDEAGEDGSAAYILKDVSENEDEEGCYIFLEDDTEYDAVFKVFEAMLEDIEFL
jgi:uncharacterized protein YrzB (UPF0473 family)